MLSVDVEADDLVCAALPEDHMVAQSLLSPSVPLCCQCKLLDSVTVEPFAPHMCFQIGQAPSNGLMQHTQVVLLTHEAVVVLPGAGLIFPERCAV